jgi:hypothetical protein
MKATSKKPLKPFMAYIQESQHASMEKFSRKNKIPMSQLVREAIEMRISTGNPYIKGFNDGLNKAINIVSSHKASQMRFPSGKSFAELVNEEIITAQMSEQNESSERES